MKFWIEIENVGCVEDIDSLVKELGYDADELMLLTDSQDVEAIYDYFDKPGKRAGVNEFGGFFVVARDGDYDAVWGFYNCTPYTNISLWRIHWKMIDEKEHAAIGRYFAKRKCPYCEQLPIQHAAYRKSDGRWQVVCERN